MEREYGACQICGREDNLYTTYLYYNIKCECCVGDRHYETVKHCGNCNVTYLNEVHPLIKGRDGRDYKTTITNICPIFIDSNNY